MNSYLYELIATVTPKVAGKSEVRIHEVTTKQAKNRENIGIITENNKLQTATSYVIGRNDIFTSRLPHINYGGAFELEVNCSEYYGKACTKAIFNFSDFPDTTSPTAGKISGVSGAWYDSKLSGSGFNFIETAAGLFIYFYGYENSDLELYAGSGNGDTQWLLSENGPKAIIQGKSYKLKLFSGYLGNGGTFFKMPHTPNNGLKDWGTATLTLNNCDSGKLTLNGEDGEITYDIKKLANINGLSCKTST